MEFDGKRMREVRRAKDISQDHLAEATGTSRVSIYNWERGKREPSLDAIQKIANALNVPYTNLIKEG